MDLEYEFDVFYVCLFHTEKEEKFKIALEKLSALF